VSGHLWYESVRQSIPCHTDIHLEDGVKYMQGIEIVANAKNVDPGDIALRLFLQKQFYGQDCEEMLLLKFKSLAPLHH